MTLNQEVTWAEEYEKPAEHGRHDEPSALEDRCTIDHNIIRMMYVVSVMDVNSRRVNNIERGAICDHVRSIGRFVVQHVDNFRFITAILFNISATVSEKLISFN